MLFPIVEKTPRCEIFKSLNEEVLHFLSASIGAINFTKHLLSDRLRDALWSNKPSKYLFHLLWIQLKPLTTRQRQSIFNELSKKQFLQHFYEDKGHLLPVVPATVKTALGELCKHLFANSSDLVDVKIACGETLHQSFGKYRQANKNICCFCGSTELSQVRAGVEEGNQWRAANDHLLSKDKYPLFAVHPDNLVPACETCNNKAKLAKDLLNKKLKGSPNVRRRCFFPFNQSCYNYVGMILGRDEFGMRAQFIMSPNNPDTAEKLDTWNEVYQIRSRVEGKFINLTKLIDSDCTPNDLADFQQKIHDKANSCIQHVRLEAWNFWKGRLYEWLDQAGGPILEELWSSIQDGRNDADAAAEFDM